MDAGDLKIFEAVARLGGMNRAAAELNTVQSNVTARIRLLEGRLGVALFVRHSRGVTLSPAGARLLPYAQQVARLLQDASRAVLDDGVPRGRLVLGSLETTVALRLSPLLAEYAGRYPEVDLVLRTGTSVELVAAVLAQQLDGAFVCGPVAHPRLTAETVFREELVVVTAPAQANLKPLVNRHELRIVVLRSGCSYRQRLEDILARRGTVGLRVLEFGTIEALIGCAAGGLGVTLLPRGLVEPARAAGRVALHTLPPGEAFVETQFIRRHDGLSGSALAAFLALARPAAGRAEAAE